MKGKCIHVTTGDGLGLVCGRRADPHLKITTLAAAPKMRPERLCQKCRQRLWWEVCLEEIAREPRPAGWQYKFPFVMEYAYG